RAALAAFVPVSLHDALPISAGGGLPPRAVRLPRRHLLLDLLHGHRLPRLPRDRRHARAARLLLPRDSRPLQAEPACRLRVRRLVLALRRRGLAVPVRRRLLVGRVIGPVTAAVRCACRRCGRGRLFAGFLKVVERCDSCGLELAKNDSGDGPAVFLIFVLGAVIVGLALWVEAAFSPPYWLHLVIWP